MAEEIIEIEDLVEDDKNFNKGTPQGEVLMDHSLSQFGAGRSILIDQNNRIIAGNKTALAAIRKGIRKVRVIETEGDEIVAVKRTDIDLHSKKGREFALADNITGNVNLDIDYDMINKVMNEVELHPEIWDVRLKDDSTKGLMRNSGGKNQTISTDCVKFARYNIILSEEESEALQNEAKQYAKDNGSMEGFVSHLIKKYYEQQND